MSDSIIRSTPQMTPALKWATISLFLIVLAGQFDVERLTGGTVVSPVRESLVGLLILPLLLVPDVKINRGNRSLTGFGYFIPFLAWAGVSVFRGEMTEGVVSAATDILCIALICLTASLACRQDAKEFARILVVCSMWAGIVFALAGLLNESESRISAFGGGPNVFGRVTGVGLVALLYLLLTKQARSILAAFIPVLFAATVLSGSRGAMLGLVCGLLLLIPLFARSKINSHALRITLIASGVLALTFAALSDRLLPTVQSRIFDMTIVERYSSGRGDLTDIAWQMFTERPLIGWGLHSFETHAYEITGFSYPHNLILQIACELGVAGLVLIAIPIVKLLVTRPLNGRDSLIVTINAIVLLYFTVAMFSGDYYDARQLFLFSVVSFSLRIRVARQRPASTAATSHSANRVARI